MSGHERLYRALLVAYPAEHRREYSEPMTQLLRDRLRDEGGGMRSLVVWGSVVGDLLKSAMNERWEARMSFKQGWWRYSAGFIAVLMVFLGIGNLIAEDEGPYYGKVIAFAVAALAAGMIVVGLSIRSNRRAVGSSLIGTGCLPATLLTGLLWFPPVALCGVLAIATVVKAFGDAASGRRMTPASA